MLLPLLDSTRMPSVPEDLFFSNFQYGFFRILFPRFNLGGTLIKASTSVPEALPRTHVFSDQKGPTQVPS